MGVQTAARTLKDKKSGRSDDRSQASMRRIPGCGPLADTLDLQHAAGNRAVSELVQSSHASRGNDVPPLVRSVLNSSGQPLDPASRAFMEPRFGHDFSGVRVHTDARAAASARAVEARAFAVGRHVVFAAGEYLPRTLDGRRLLAHELVHTLQQQHAAAASAQPLPVSAPSDAHEAEADRIARGVSRDAAGPAVPAPPARGPSAVVTPSAAQVARQPQGPSHGTLSEEDLGWDGELLRQARAGPCPTGACHAPSGTREVSRSYERTFKPGNVSSSEALNVSAYLPDEESREFAAYLMKGWAMQEPPSGYSSPHYPQRFKLVSVIPIMAYSYEGSSQIDGYRLTYGEVTREDPQGKVNNLSPKIIIDPYGNQIGADPTEAPVESEGLGPLDYIGPPRPLLRVGQRVVSGGTRLAERAVRSPFRRFAGMTKGFRAATPALERRALTQSAGPLAAGLQREEREALTAMLAGEGAVAGATPLVAKLAAPPPSLRQRAMKGLDDWAAQPAGGLSSLGAKEADELLKAGWRRLRGGRLKLAPATTPTPKSKSAPPKGAPAAQPAAPKRAAPKAEPPKTAPQTTAPPPSTRGRTRTVRPAGGHVKDRRPPTKAKGGPRTADGRPASSGAKAIRGGRATAVPQKNRGGGRGMIQPASMAGNKNNKGTNRPTQPSRGAPARRNKPRSPNASIRVGPNGTLIGRSERQFRRDVRRILLADKNNPLSFLLSKGRFRRTRGKKHSQLADSPDSVQMGHVESAKGGGKKIVLQDAHFNQFDNVTIESKTGVMRKSMPVVDIGGFGVELRTAKMWEEAGKLAGKLPRGTKVDNLPRIDL